MNSHVQSFAVMHGNSDYQVPVLGTTLANVLCAMSPLSGNTTSGGVTEHRGIHWTDKRFSAFTGIQFVGKYPFASLFEIVSRKKEADMAVKGRKYATTKMTTKQYMQSLVIRCLRGQILNPVLRIDYAVRLLEKLRKAAMNNKFVRSAIQPHNAQAAATIILFN